MIVIRHVTTIPTRTKLMHRHGSVVSALLADGSLYKWTDGDREPISPKICVESVAMVASYLDTQIILTHSNQVLYSKLSDNKIIHITWLIERRLGDNLTEPITEIYMYKRLLVARAGNRICIIHLTPPTHSRPRGIPSKLHVFPGGIDLISFGCHHGFIKTSDGLLYVTDGEDCSTFNSQMNIEPIDITDPHNIRDIVSGPLYSLFIMNDSSVQAYRRANTSKTGDISKGIQPLELCQTENIAKVIPRDVNIFYITTEGACYYHDVLSQIKHRSGIKHFPVQLKSLIGLDVENVFDTNASFIVQNDAGKLCLLPKEQTDHGLDMDLEHVYGTKAPVPLPFFDDKSIVDITQAHSCIYFTTSEGHVYQARSDRFIEELTAERIEFFDENPVAVNMPAPRLASGRSCLDD